MKKTILALGLMVAFVSCNNVVNEEVLTTDSTAVVTDSIPTDTLVVTIDSVEVVK